MIAEKAIHRYSFGANGRAIKPAAINGTTNRYRRTTVRCLGAKTTKTATARAKTVIPSTIECCSSSKSEASTGEEKARAIPKTKGITAIATMAFHKSLFGFAEVSSCCLRGSSSLANKVKAEQSGRAAVTITARKSGRTVTTRYKQPANALETTRCNPMRSVSILLHNAPHVTIRKELPMPVIAMPTTATAN